jgi:bifunctional non-homologous end joining protein LigD
MLAKLHDAPFDDDNWIFEIKWDGYRAIAETGKGAEPRLYSRNKLNFADKYHSIFDELKKIKKDAIIDGEIVALDENGAPSFQLLQSYDPETTPLIYYVFDCLYVGGKSIEDKPLTERKAMLQKLLPKSDLIKYCDHIETEGKAFFALAKKQYLEGIIAKRADSTYSEGARSNDWLKIKNVQTQEAVIAGYTEPRGGRKFFGALVLGIYEGKKLVYIGHTGTGFDDKTLKDTYNKLQPLVTDKSPFEEKVKVNAPVTWVKPKLVCNVKFSEITKDNIRRHPVFMGLRVDKAAKDVHAEFALKKETKKATRKTAK